MTHHYTEIVRGLLVVLPHLKLSKRLLSPYVGQLAHALDVPWYANLGRVETRFYTDQYDGKVMYGLEKLFIGTFHSASLTNILFSLLSFYDQNLCVS
ncbi:hypothetical protein MTR_7g011690 [Medicago truncatula]|uniref:Uncharacterized protein n=1 Tax=Medicago truncatula TaxID=3880 RepID=G7L337_MEDTR|nr:hypothetical protein MTR_7g011690 [Medicago truncatula]